MSMVASFLVLDMNTPLYGLAGAVAQPNMTAPTKIKYVLYARKSTESEEKQVLSIDSQINEKRIDRKGQVIVDPQRAPVVKQMFEKVAYEKWTGRRLYHWLKFDMNFRSSTSNKPLTLSNIYRLLQLPFYAGTFEYPAGSGNWYAGKHTPIISRELFDKTVEQLKRDRITHPESKEFAFTKLITCGLCG